MKRRSIRMTKDQKGFTLVELLLAVGIAALAAAAIFGFMVVGAKSFNSTSSDINVQYESQLVFNKMQDLLVDTCIGVEYGYSTAGNTDADYIEIVKDSDIPSGTDVTYKRLIMYNYDDEDPEKKVYEVIWDADKAEVYYNEYEPSVTTDAEGNEVVEKGSALYTDQLMGEHFTAFAADLSDMESRRIVRVNLTFEKSGKEYKSSHNITLRNKIANGARIPEYVEATNTKDPYKVVGLTEVYMMPGDSLDLKSAGSYEVQNIDGSRYSNQDIRFYISNSFVPAAGTTVSTNGLINVSKAQKDDFYITVATRSGRGTPCTVHVNLIIVTAVAIEFVPDPATADDELPERNPNGVYYDDLVESEAFTLTATVTGRNLDKAPSGSGAYGVRWELQGDAGDLITMGSSSESASGGSCSFKMKESFTLSGSSTTKSLKVRAYSSLSESIPYTDASGNASPVYGEIELTAFKDKGNFPAYDGGANLKRGEHTPDAIEPYADVDSMFKPGGILYGTDYETWKTKHNLLVDVHVYELRYTQENSSPSGTYTKKEVDYSVSKQNTINYIRGEGTHVGIMAPKPENSSPNVAYEYDITFYVFDTDGTNWGTTRVIKNDHNDGEVVKDLSQAVYKSNTVKATCDRIFLYYNNRSVLQGWTGSSIYSWVPRLKLNSSSASIYTRFPLYVSNNVADQEVIARSYFGPYRFYQKVDGSWKEYDDDHRLDTVGNYLTVKNENGSFYMQLNMSSWKEPNMTTNGVFSLPMTVRAVPDYRYTEYDLSGSKGQETDVMFDDYVEIKLWNIAVPALPSNNNTNSYAHFYATSDGTIIQTGYYTHAYFPLPSDEVPSGQTYDSYYSVLDRSKYPSGTPSRKTWTKPYPQDSKSLYYSLEFNYNASGAKVYTLHLYGKSSSNYYQLADYTCSETDEYWKMTQKFN